MQIGFSTVLFNSSFDTTIIIIHKIISICKITKMVLNNNDYNIKLIIYLGINYSVQLRTESENTPKWPNS